MIEIEHLIRPELARLKNEYPDLASPKGFAYPRTVEPNAVLFIGLNPSEADPVDSDGFFSYRLKEERLGGHFGPQLKWLREIKLAAAYTHLDVLYSRGSGEEEIEQLMRGGGANFICGQLKITRAVLGNLMTRLVGERPEAPVAVVVASRKAQRLLGYYYNPGARFPEEWMGLKFIPQNIGASSNEAVYYHCPDWGTVPVLFTTQFTGQHTYSKSDQANREAVANTLRALLNKQ